MWNDQWYRSHSQTELYYIAFSLCSDSWWLHKDPREPVHWWSDHWERLSRHSSLCWYRCVVRDRTLNWVRQGGQGYWDTLKKYIIPSGWFSDTFIIPHLCIVFHFEFELQFYSLSFFFLFFTLCSLTSCLIRQRIDLPEHNRLHRFHYTCNTHLQ